jgi:hypothetical protein
MSIEPTDNGRRRLMLVAACFIVPLLLAALLYYGGILRPSSSTNNGALLQPIVNLADRLPESPLHEAAAGRWVLLYANAGDCGEACRDALYRLRQSRLMLGNDMDRVVRVFLHGDSVPDRVFLEGQHSGLVSMTDRALAEVLENKRPTELQDGGCYLIDPLGNLVMYFAPDLDPGDMNDDIEHLLKLSRIG